MLEDIKAIYRDKWDIVELHDKDGFVGQLWDLSFPYGKFSPRIRKTQWIFKWRHNRQLAFSFWGQLEIRDH